MVVGIKTKLLWLLLTIPALLVAYSLPSLGGLSGPLIIPTPYHTQNQSPFSLSFVGSIGPSSWKHRVARATSSPRPQNRIVIDVNKRQLTLYQKGEILGTFPVAVGKSSTPTPVGEWKIRNKSMHWGGGFGTRWLGLNVPWGIYGIHGTNKPYSIGRAASHGCIRMYNRHVEKLFPQVEVGMEVIIRGPEPQVVFRSYIDRGSSGRDVLMVQKQIRRAGLKSGPIDGRFGPQTEKAVKNLQLFFGLRPDGCAGANVYHLLNIR